MATIPCPDLDPGLYDDDFFCVASKCTVEAWLAFLGHRWNALILYHVSLGPKRFGELSDILSTATPKVLTERLAALEQYGLIRRPNGARGDPYVLGERGEALMPILHDIEVWSRAMPKIELTR